MRSEKIEDLSSFFGQEDSIKPKGGTSPFVTFGSQILL